MTNIDLLTVGIAASAIGIMGFVAYLNDRNNRTTQTFLLFALLTILWTISNIAQYQFTTIQATLHAMRINLFVATWHAFAFFLFSYTFPRTEVLPSRIVKYGLFPLTLAVSILTLTPFVFSGIDYLAPLGEVTNPTRGSGIVFFVAMSLGLLGAGILSLFTKVKRAQSLERKQLRYVLIGMTLTAFLILSFSMFFPIFLNDLSYLPYSALFFLPLIGLVSYSIYRYRLFSMKIVAVQTLTFALGILTFGEVLTTSDPLKLAFRIVLLIAIAVAGILLTRSVTKEVEQRELIEAQRKELEIANKQQQSLLHFISHEVKSYLTSGQGAFSAIVEGDYGEAPPKLKGVAEGALGKMREGVQMVMEILDASNLRLGTVTYKKEPFDFRAAVEDVVARLRPKASERHLTLDISVDTIKDYVVTGDGEKISQHVIRNLVDNAIRYTPKGSVHVTLARTDGHIRFSVKDSGVGITEEDKANLFTEGGRGKESIKVNVDSTGYGLFVAKQVVTAHGGTIRAESAGAGKGSEFIVELPAKEV